MPQLVDASDIPEWIMDDFARTIFAEISGLVFNETGPCDIVRFEPRQLSFGGWMGRLEISHTQGRTIVPYVVACDRGSTPTIRRVSRETAGIGRLTWGFPPPAVPALPMPPSDRSPSPEDTLRVMGMAIHSSPHVPIGTVIAIGEGGRATVALDWNDRSAASVTGLTNHFEEEYAAEFLEPEIDTSQYDLQGPGLDEERVV